MSEIRKPACKTFPRHGLIELFQGDLVKLIPYVNLNKGFRYIRVVIDVFKKQTCKQTEKETRCKLQKISLNCYGKKLFNYNFGKKNENLQSHFSSFSNLKKRIID